MIVVEITRYYLVSSLLPCEIVNKYGGAEVSTYDGVLKFATKMALYQPRRAVIATVLANFMPADFAEGLLDRHKQGKTK